MIPNIQVDPGSKTPLYKQLMRQFENAIHGGGLTTVSNHFRMTRRSTF